MPASARLRVEAAAARGREAGAALQFMLDAVIDGTLPNEKQALLKVLSTEFASNATE